MKFSGKMLEWRQPDLLKAGPNRKGTGMEQFPINWLALLACVIFKQALGAAWYSPALFGARWSALTGVSPQEMQSGIVRALVPDVIEIGRAHV